METDYLHALTPAQFSILLALADEELHGTAIIEQVLHESNQYISLASGTLYECLKQLAADALIIHSKTAGRNKYYKITADGEQFLEFELTRYQRAIEIAKDKKVLPK